MALVRELIRQEKRNLGLVCLVGGMAVDWLSAAGVIDRFIGAAVSMEQFGLCNQYRKAVESGRVRVEELSETALNARLGAGARNLPFLPTRGMLGSDLIDINPNLVRFQDPFDGRDARRVPRARPGRRVRARAPRRRARQRPDRADRALAGPRHLPQGREEGRSSRWRRSSTRRCCAGTPTAPCCPGSRSTPSSRCPTARTRRRFFPNYGYDTRFHLEWVEGGARRRGDGRVPRAVRHRARATQAAYLEAVGGAERLIELTRGMSESGYTVDEIMCATLAAQFARRRRGLQRHGLVHPGRRDHAGPHDARAPDLVWLAGAAGVDPRPDRVPASTLEAPLWRDSVMYLEQFSDFWHYAQNGRHLADLLRRRRAARHVRQREQLGHRRRLPPAEGAPARHGGARRHGRARQAPPLLEPEPQPARRSSRRSTSSRAAGYLGGGDERERLGLGGGPELVVTNLAVLDFEPESKAMRLRSVHPGVTVEQVREATGFELIVPGEVPETPPPTPEQVRLLREEIDPDGMCKREAGVEVDGLRVRSARERSCRPPTRRSSSRSARRPTATTRSGGRAT